MNINKKHNHFKELEKTLKAMTTLMLRIDDKYTTHVFKAKNCILEIVKDLKTNEINTQ